MALKLTASIIALALLAGGAVWSLQPAQPSDPLLGAANAETTAAAPAGELDPALLGDRTMGSPDAPIKLTEYASFTCPHCAHFNETVFHDLKKNYIDTGKVFFTYREVYFDKFGLWAGMLARCGGADRYFGFVETYYANRDTWLASTDPADITEALKRIGRTGGMTTEQIDQCLNNQPLAESLVTTFQTNMEADKIEGTPSFIIDGEKFSNMSYDEFAAVLDAKLK